MKIPDRVALLEELKQMIANRQNQLSRFQDGTRACLPTDEYITVCNDSDDISGWKYHVDLLFASKKTGAVAVNFGHKMHPSFEHKAFFEMIQERYENHMDGYDFIIINNLEPEEAVDLVVSIIEEYAEYRSGLELLW